MSMTPGRAWIFILILCAALGAAAWFSYVRVAEPSVPKNLPQTEDAYAGYFAELARTQGGRYAFDVLKRTDIPAAVNVHTVAHAIGDILYSQEGTAGMASCTQDFRNACSHSIVIQTFINDGAKALSKIRSACEYAPGGKGAYAICFHGVGHGLMAYLGYDFKEAVAECARMTGEEPASGGTGHRFTDTREECIGGAVMELVQGSHDAAAQARAVTAYMPLDDPFRPCTDEYVPEDLRTACIVSLTERFFGYAGIGDKTPDPSSYPSAMAACALNAKTDERGACYAGFGKEFVFFATELNGGDATRLSDEALRGIWTWCGYAPTIEDASRCASIAVDSLFWAGQNNPRSSVRFCSVAPGEQKRACFAGLVENIRHFLEGESKADACALLPSEFAARCAAVTIEE
jgi:hypothetical protein